MILTQLMWTYLCFISLLYLDLYVLGDDALISKGSFMQTKHLCVLITLVNVYVDLLVFTRIAGTS